MILFQQSFDSFSSLNYIISSLNEVIGTYIPTGNNVVDVINNVNNANLPVNDRVALKLTEESLFITYTSTPIQLKIIYDFTRPYQKILVHLQDYQAIPGNKHYEALTELFYSSSFINEDQVVIPKELQRLNPQTDFYNLFPNWTRLFLTDQNYINLKLKNIN
jgi:hypothetical protein